MENKFDDNIRDGNNRDDNNKHESSSIYNSDMGYESDNVNHNPSVPDSEKLQHNPSVPDSDKLQHNPSVYDSNNLHYNHSVPESSQITNNYTEAEIVISSDNPITNENNSTKEVYSPNLNHTQHPNYYNSTSQNANYSTNPYQANPYQANQAYQPNYNNYYQGYQNNAQPNNASKQEKKPKKKGSFGPMKLVAAAIAFGVIAGTAFQGYSYLAQLMADPNVIIEEEKFEISQADSSVIPVNSDTNGIISDVSGVVENVMPSIVAINSSATVTSYDFFGRRFNEPVQGSGSGIIIGQNGSEILIVTNNHVIDGAEKVEIVFVDESIAMATVKGAEAKADLAVISVKLSDLSKETSSKIKVATLGDSNQVKAGEMAIAIGNALGYGQSVTVGYISALNREVNIENVKMNLLQTDAAINPGNSGGALINIYGQVIGINSVKYASAEVEGMGYAIPISDAVPLINELMNREILEDSEKGFLGIRLDNAQEVTEIFSKRFNMPIGIYVNSIVANSPAEKAGLKEGNIIVGVNDKKVETIEDLLNILSYTRAGEKITLVINELDNGKYIEKKLEVVLEKRPNN